ncbi:MAG: hypothetical protein JWO29_390 [Arthrobacter sp.]|nr:hypothetical protein [Arthrobacter sp.]
MAGGRAASAGCQHGDPEDRRGAVLVGGDEQGGPVRKPGGAARPAVPVVGKRRQVGFPCGGTGNVQQVQQDQRCRERSGVAFAEHHQGPVVRADRTGEVAHSLDVEQDGAGAGRDVEGQQHGPGVGVRERLVEAAVDGFSVRAHDGFRFTEPVSGTWGEVAQLSRRGGIHCGGLARLRLFTGLDGEKPRLRGAQVGIPVAHGVAAVQDGGDLFLLAALAAFLVLVLVGGTSQHGRRDEKGAGLLGGEDSIDTTRTREHHTRLAAVGRQHPQRADGVRLGAVRIGTRGCEVQITVGRERRAGLTLGAAGDPAGTLSAFRVKLPQGCAVFGALGIERGHGGDQPPAVGAQRQAIHPGDRQVMVQVMEGGLGWFAQGLWVRGSHALIQHPACPASHQVHYE